MVYLFPLIPLLGALLCLGPWFGSESGARRLKFFGIVTAISTLFIVIISGSMILADGVLSQSISYPWIPAFGVSLHFTLDGLSFSFALLTALVSLAVLTWSSVPNTAPRTWFALVLAAEGAVMGAFVATDLVLFYVFYELMLLPVLGAIAWFGGERRLQAALKFVVYTVAASLCMFLAIAYIGFRGRVVGGETFSFDVFSVARAGFLTPAEQTALGLAFLVAFAVKIPIVPFHSWLPDTYREAPHAMSAFVAAVLGKVGIYGIIRFVYPLFPQFVLEYGAVLAWLGAAGVLYGALAAMAQKDLKGLLAYSSLSHLGFCVLGLAGASTMAVSGVVFQSVSHGIVTAGLFLAFGALIDGRGSRDFESFGGLAGRTPKLAALLMVLCLGSVALPLTSGFVGEFLIVMGSFARFSAPTILALTGVVLGAVYTLTAYKSIMFGEARSSSAGAVADVHGLNSVVLVVMAMLIVVLGVYPAPLLRIIEPAVTAEHSTGVIERTALGSGVGLTGTSRIVFSYRTNVQE